MGADQSALRPRLAGLWIGSLILVVFAGKLLLMRAIPVMTPFWDQWDGEAAVLFAPFSGCGLTWRDMVGFHNEHRVFFTRLLALDLLVLDGQWDPRLEQVVNAGVHTFTAGLMALMFWLAAGRRRLDIAVALAAVTFALPFSWENSLFGFQSAFYFLLLFSLLALWLTTQAPTGSLTWLAGWACAACALFTAASGLLAPVAIGAMWTLQALDDRPGELRDAAINVALALGIFLVGYAVSSPPLPHHEVYRVKSAVELAIALGRSLAWPRIDRPVLAIVAWLPLALVCLTAAWRRFQTTALERFTIALWSLGWVACRGFGVQPRGWRRGPRGSLHGLPEPGVPGQRDGTDDHLRSFADATGASACRLGRDWNLARDRCRRVESSRPAVGDRRSGTRADASGAHRQCQTIHADRRRGDPPAQGSTL